VARRRALVSERWLARQLDDMTSALRSGWPAPKRLLWLGRDVEERVVGGVLDGLRTVCFFVSRPVPLALRT
jgi:hypothetical protein